MNIKGFIQQKVIKMSFFVLLFHALAMYGNSEICIGEKIVVANISGYVVIPNDEKPLAFSNATVELFDKHNKLLAKMQTDQKGQFLFRNAKADDYILTAYYEVNDKQVGWHPISVPLKLVKAKRNKKQQIIVITLRSDPDLYCGGSTIEVLTKEKLDYLLPK